MTGSAIPCVLVCVASTLMAAASVLEVVRPIVSQSDGGTSLPPGFAHVPGEVLFLTFQVSGFQKDSNDKVRIGYTVDALDSRGVKAMETVSNEVTAELAPQDKEWMPKVRMEVPLPPLAHSGTYKLVVNARDLVAKTSAEKTINVEVRGHKVQESETLTVRNFRYFRGEDDQEALARPVYRAGDPVWARFDITGYKFGKNNAIDFVYGIAVIAGSGKTLWSQPEAAVERSESFYPKRYVPGAMSITLQNNIRPGDYIIAVQVKDAVGGQTFEGKYTFSVEP